MESRAQTIVEGLRAETLTAPEPVVTAFAATTRAEVAVLVAINTQIGELETALADHFDQHPDTAIYLSLPGIGVVLGA